MFAAKLIIAITLAVVAVNAQDTTAASGSGSASATGSGAGSLPSGIAGVTPCILTCVTTAAAANGCSGPTDLQCICTNTAFQTAAQDCLTKTCTADEQAASLELQKSQCAAIGGSASASQTGSGSPSGTPSGSGAVTGSVSTTGSKTASAPNATGSGPSGKNGAASLSGNVMAAVAAAVVGVVAL